MALGVIGDVLVDSGVECRIRIASGGEPLAVLSAVSSEYLPTSLRAVSHASRRSHREEARCPPHGHVASIPF